MASIIKPRRGTSAPTTGEINQNELAVDTTNKRIYIGAADGSGTLIGSAPAGSDTQVQFNDGGVLGGDSGLVYNKSTDTLTVGSLVSTGGISVNGTVAFTFEGAIENANEVFLLVTEPSADRYLVLPDANGTLATTALHLGSFGATTSAQLAGVISDETGSGSLVFASSPTLTTPNIGVASGTSLTLTGDAAINGGDITSTQTTFNLLNSTVTTLNIGGATSSTINLGATGGTSTVDLNANIVKDVELRNYYETEGTPSYVGGTTTLTVDLSTANVFTYTTTGSIGTIAVTNIPSKAGTAVGFTLVITCGDALYSVAFDTFASGTIKWAGGTPPASTTTVGNTDIISYTTYDGGTTWYGFVGGQNFS